MASAGAPETAGQRASVRARIAAAAPWVVRVAVGLTLLHLLDDGFRHGFAEVLLPAAAAVAIALGFPLLRPGLQAWVAFVYGAVAALDAGVHVSHLSRGGAFGLADLTGFLHAAGGIALLVVAAAIALRPKERRPPGRRWLVRIGAVVGTLATVLFLVYPLFLASYAVHKPSVRVDDATLGVPHEEVTLHTSDGLDLAASYVPSRNGAAVVLVHGAGGDRAGSIASRARMLARHGYGVLLYDARGCGNSDGRPENLAWTWPRDVRAALDYVASRPDVEAGKIGALGLSSGAETLLEAAADDRRIAAVVAEGAQAHTFAEARALPGGDGVEAVLVLGPAVAAYAALSLQLPPEPIQEQLPRIAPRPVFLIAADTSYEHAATELYRDAATGPVELWWPEDTPHTGGLKAHPREYEQRVIAFLDDALL
ncbi:MAG TPA: alpha/beta fold hydrolase [Gaiellaceae bacterium]|nr:alpha/beta fold hydrolase [Gaiellaceae bacterium]